MLVSQQAELLLSSQWGTRIKNQDVERTEMWENLEQRPKLHDASGGLLFLQVYWKEVHSMEEEHHPWLRGSDPISYWPCPFPQ